ncbi:MAG: pyroglutamyl-peptidase I [Anaerolineales bacterium]|nr:pyroglutamyl-peptidase I [Anaerolineales bacterium]
MKILLTGFEPFGNQTINPSQLVVEQLAQEEIEGVSLITAVLPVDRFQGPDALIRAFIRAQPDAIVCLGEAGGRTAIAIERVAINLLDFNIPDNSGVQLHDEPVRPDGDIAFFSTLPIREIEAALKEAAIPAALSLSAGTFLCNQIFYTIMHYLHKYKLNKPAGFVHLPQLPEQVVAERPLRPSMSLDMMCQGVTLILQTIANHPTVTVHT